MHCAIRRDVESTVQTLKTLFSQQVNISTIGYVYLLHKSRYFTVNVLFSPRKNYKCVDTKLFEVEIDEDCGLLQDDSDILDNACADPLLGSSI